MTATPNIQHLISQIAIMVEQQEHIEGGFIVDSGGQMLASIGLDHIDEKRLGSLAVSLYTLSRQIAQEQGIGAMEQIYLKSQWGYIQNFYADDNANVTAWLVMKPTTSAL